MFVSQVLKCAEKEVRVIMSRNKEEARKRALILYKAYYRLLPWIYNKFDVPKSMEQMRCKLREEFTKHPEYDDVRVIDLLIIQGQMELKAMKHFWVQKRHLMEYFKEYPDTRPKDFLSKFLDGHND